MPAVINIPQFRPSRPNRLGRSPGGIGDVGAVRVEDFVYGWKSLPSLAWYLRVERRDEASRKVTRNACDVNIASPRRFSAADLSWGFTVEWDTLLY